MLDNNYKIKQIEDLKKDFLEKVEIKEILSKVDEECKKSLIEGQITNKIKEAEHKSLQEFYEERMIQANNRIKKLRDLSKEISKENSGKCIAYDGATKMAIIINQEERRRAKRELEWGKEQIIDEDGLASNYRKKLENLERYLHNYIEKSSEEISLSNINRMRDSEEKVKYLDIVLCKAYEKGYDDEASKILQYINKNYEIARNFFKARLLDAIRMDDFQEFKNIEELINDYNKGKKEKEIIDITKIAYNISMVNNRGSDNEKVETVGKNLLYLATEYESQEIFEHLIKKYKMNVNSVAGYTDENGVLRIETIANAAVRFKNLNVIRFLNDNYIKSTNYLKGDLLTQTTNDQTSPIINVKDVAKMSTRGGRNIMQTIMEGDPTYDRFEKIIKKLNIVLSSTNITGIYNEIHVTVKLENEKNIKDFLSKKGVNEPFYSLKNENGTITFYYKKEDGIKISKLLGELKEKDNIAKVDFNNAIGIAISRNNTNFIKNLIEKRSDLLSKVSVVDFDALFNYFIKIGDTSLMEKLLLIPTIINNIDLTKYFEYLKKNKLNNFLPILATTIAKKSFKHSDFATFANVVKYLTVDSINELENYKINGKNIFEIIIENKNYVLAQTLLDKNPSVFNNISIPADKRYLIEPINGHDKYIYNLIVDSTSEQKAKRIFSGEEIRLKVIDNIIDSVIESIKDRSIDKKQLNKNIKINKRNILKRKYNKNEKQQVMKKFGLSNKIIIEDNYLAVLEMIQNEINKLKKYELNKRIKVWSEEYRKRSEELEDASTPQKIVETGEINNSINPIDYENDEILNEIKKNLDDLRTKLDVLDNNNYFDVSSVNSNLNDSLKQENINNQIGRIINYNVNGEIGTPLEIAIDLDKIELVKLILTQDSLSTDENIVKKLNDYAKKTGDESLNDLIKRKGLLSKQNSKEIFIEAVKNNNVNLLKNVYSSKMLNKEIDGKTPLQIAVENSNISIFNYLINKDGILINKNNPILLTNDSYIIKSLLKRDDLDVKTVDLLLGNAVFSGNINVVEYILSDFDRIQYLNKQNIENCINNSKSNYKLHSLLQNILKKSTNPEEYAKDEVRIQQENRQIIEQKKQKNRKLEELNQILESNGNNALYDIISFLSNNTGINLDSNLENLSQKARDNLIVLIAKAKEPKDALALMNNFGINLNNLKHSSNMFLVHLAVKEGNIPLLEFLIQNYGNEIINQPLERTNQTPIILAMAWNKKDVVNYLLGERAKLNDASVDGSNTLYYAVISKNADMVNKLLQSDDEKNNINQKIKYSDGSEFSLIFKAIEEVKDVKIIKLLLKQKSLKVDLNEKNKYGQSILHLIYRLEDKLNNGLNKGLDNSNLVLYFIEKYVNNSNVNVVDNEGRIPLHHAIANNNSKEIISRLCKVNGIDINKKDINGKTPLSIAFENKNVELIKYLLTLQSIDVNLVGNKKLSPLFMAIQSKNDEIINLLLERKDLKLDFNKKDIKGKSIVHYAVENENMNLLNNLSKQSGFNINVEDNYGMTPIYYAIKNRNVELVKFMLSLNNININKTYKLLPSPLFFAIESGNLEIVDFLLNREDLEIDFNEGRSNVSIMELLSDNITLLSKFFDKNKIDLNMKSKDDNTLLSYAIYNNNYEVANFILSRENINIINQKNDQGISPFFIAVANNNNEIIELLLKRKDLKIDFEEEYYGKNLLDYVVENGNLELIKRLYDKYPNDVDLTKKDRSGRTPIQHFTKDFKNKNIFEFIENKTKEQEEQKKKIKQLENKMYESNEKLITEIINLAKKKKFEEIDKIVLNVPYIDKETKNKIIILATEFADLQSIISLNKRLKLGDLHSIKDSFETDLLGKAIENSNFTLVKELVESKNFNLNRLIGSKSTFIGESSPLHLALNFNRNNNEIVKYILSNNVNINVKDGFGLSPFFVAVGNNNMEIINLFLKRKDLKIDFTEHNSRFFNGDNILDVVLNTNNLVLLNELLNRLMKEPLSVKVACERSLNKIIKKLNSKIDLSSIRALDLAKSIIEPNEKKLFEKEKQKFISMINKIRSNSYIDMERLPTFNSIPVKDKEDIIIKISSVPTNDPDVITMLADKFNLSLSDIRDDGGKGLLSYVAESGNIDLLKTLVLKEGVDINSKDNSNFSSLYYALNNSNVNVFKYLLSYSNDVNEKFGFNNSISLLETAILKNNLDAVKILLSNPRIDVNITNINGQTPIFSAVASNNTEIVKLLLKRDDIILDDKIIRYATNKYANPVIIDLLKSKINEEQTNSILSKSYSGEMVRNKYIKPGNDQKISVDLEDFQFNNKRNQKSLERNKKSIKLLEKRIRLASMNMQRELVELAKLETKIEEFRDKLLTKENQEKLKKLEKEKEIIEKDLNDRKALVSVRKELLSVKIKKINSFIVNIERKYVNEEEMEKQTKIGELLNEIYLNKELLDKIRSSNETLSKEDVVLTKKGK